MAFSVTLQYSCASILKMNNTHLRLRNCLTLVINVEQTKVTFISNVVTCVLSALFSLITSISNGIVLHVIRKTRELHSPSYILLFCLALSDLLVGLICHPFFIAYHIAELVADNFSVHCTFKQVHMLFGWMTTAVSFLTLSAVSVDRLLSLTLHLRYGTIVTVRRVLPTVFLLWMFAISIVIPMLWMIKWKLVLLVILIITSFLTVVSALKIVQIVRRHQRQIHQQQQSVQLQVNTVNVLKCRKSALTVLFVHGLFSIFYIPFCVTTIMEQIIGRTVEIEVAYDFTITFVFVNSFLNPFVYCWRIREIRRAVKNTLRKN